MRITLPKFLLLCAIATLAACGSGSSNNTIDNNVAPPSPTTYSVGGSVTGLTTGALVLKNNGGDALTASANATRFNFATPLAEGAAYNVTIDTQPTGLTCAVSNGNGTVAGANVTNVSIVCAVNTYTLGGTVSGLNGGTLVLQNSSNTLSITSNGAFTFPTPLPEGSSFAVSVASQPAAQGCAVTNGSGSMSANINNITVACSSTTLVASVSNLTVAASGNARVVVITNIGSISATNVAYSITPALPSGTALSTTCSATLAPGSSCTVTVTPGSSASAAAGSAPTTSALSVMASNSNTAIVNLAVVDIGNIYQGGYIFAINDATSTTTSIGGKVAALTDQSTSQLWGGSGTAITGVNENSVASSTSCDGATDGECDTTRIVTALSPASSAAGLCTNLITGGYSDWYLPAICELGVDTTSAGSSCSAGSPNVYTNLVANGLGGFSANFYLSSTQYSVTPNTRVWGQSMAASGASQGRLAKFTAYFVRCARALTP